jgi:hypothetical protein
MLFINLSRVVTWMLCAGSRSIPALGGYALPSDDANGATPVAVARIDHVIGL